MKFNTVFITLFMLFSLNTFAQYGNFQMDNGIIKGVYSSQVNFEETVILKPPVPGDARKVFVYLSGTVAAKDTIWIVGDPTDGNLPPTLWCNYINAYKGAIIDYPGAAGWYEIDLTDYKGIEYNGIPTGGLNGIAIQHTIKTNGPYFTIDTQPQTPQNANSFLNDVYKPNPDFYNIQGTIISYTQGRYMVRLQMEYKFKDSAGNPAAQPEALLVDETVQKGLVNDTNQPVAFEMASVADWNNDGFDDISIAGNYFQNKGDGSFQNISDKVNIQNSGSVWADVDNDGFMDFYAVRSGSADRIYYGKADGTYEESTNNIFAIDAPSVTPLFFDYNKDGLLDLFIGYGRRDSSGTEKYYQDKLYKNLGSRQFKDVTAESGIAASEPSPFYDTWASSLCDYNNDGLTDIFVATYRLAPDLLYKNNGDGTFTEVGKSTAVRGAPTYYENYFGHGMGSDWGNLSNYDKSSVGLVVGNLGHPDSRALSSNPSLAWEKGSTTSEKFSDVTKEVDLRFYEMNAGVLFVDLNNDGMDDLVHCQYSYDKKGVGKDKNTRFYIARPPEGLGNNILDDRTWELGPRIHGAWSPVRGDVDNDGRTDVVAASSNENVKLFSNKMEAGNWISFKFEGDGTKVNKNGFGTRVDFYGGSLIIASKYLPGTVINARAAQSSSDLHFAMSPYYDSVVVTFQDGKKLNLGKVVINRKYLVKYEGNVVPFPVSRPILSAPSNNSNFSEGKLFNLEWLHSGGAAKYRFQIAKKSNFGSGQIEVQGTMSQNKTSFQTLIKGKYYWRVASIDSNDAETAWSDVWAFNIIDSVRIVTLIFPENNSTNISLQTDFSWSDIEAFKAVNFQLSKTSDFKDLIIDYKNQSENMITSYTPPDTTLTENTKYFWRVRAADKFLMNDEAEWRPWSETFSFTTKAGSSAENEISEVRFGFTVIYPNPADAQARFEFELPYFANISVAIFDLKGGKIADVTEAYFEPGVHSVNFNTSALPNGTYYLRITDGVHIQSETLNVVR